MILCGSAPTAFAQERKPSEECVVPSSIAVHVPPPVNCGYVATVGAPCEKLGSATAKPYASAASIQWVTFSHAPGPVWPVAMTRGGAAPAGMLLPRWTTVPSARVVVGLPADAAGANVRRSGSTVVAATTSRVACLAHDVTRPALMR